MRDTLRGEARTHVNHALHVSRSSGASRSRPIRAVDCTLVGVYRQRSLYAEPNEAFTAQEAFGQGLVWVRTGNRFTFLTCTTPIDEEYTWLWMLFLVDDGPGSPGGRALSQATADSAGRDVVIWGNKV